MAAKSSLAWLPKMLIGFSASAALARQYEHDALHAGPGERLGQVKFPVSCSAAAQAEFNRAMALFHSFWFDPAKQFFGKVLEHDPGCGIAHWGIAIMSMGNPFTWPPSPVVIKAAEAALVEARRVGAKSEREHDYIAAFTPGCSNWR